MIQYISGDIFEHVTKLTYPIILPHICNDKKVMGAGFAKIIAKKWPGVYKVYAEGEQRQGIVTYCQPTKYITVANMVAQTLYTERPLNYERLVCCMNKVAIHCEVNYIKDIHTIRFGSGLAKGNPQFIEELMIDCWEKRHLNVTVYEI